MRLGYLVISVSKMPSNSKVLTYLRSYQNKAPHHQEASDYRSDRTLLPTHPDNSLYETRPLGGVLFELSLALASVSMGRVSSGHEE